MEPIRLGSILSWNGKRICDAVILQNQIYISVMYGKDEAKHEEYCLVDSIRDQIWQPTIFSTNGKQLMRTSLKDGKRCLVTKYGKHNTLEYTTLDELYEQVEQMIRQKIQKTA